MQCRTMPVLSERRMVDKAELVNSLPAVWRQLAALCQYVAVRCVRTHDLVFPYLNADIAGSVVVCDGNALRDLRVQPLNVYLQVREKHKCVGIVLELRQ
jgi:hypothetical protein